MKLIDLPDRHSRKLSARTGSKETFKQIMKFVSYEADTMSSTPYHLAQTILRNPEGLIRWSQELLLAWERPVDGVVNVYMLTDAQATTQAFKDRRYTDGSPSDVPAR